MNPLIRFASLVSFGILLAACVDSPSAPELSAILSVEIDSSVAPLIRAFSVELDGPGDIEIDYQAAGSAPLRLASAAPATQHSLIVTQLRPSDVYDYQVRTVGSGGRRGEPVSGSFSTDPLPAELVELSFEASGQSSTPLTMLEVRFEEYFAFVVIDRDAKVVWYWPTEFRPSGFARMADGNFVFLDYGRGLVVVSPDRRVVAELPQDTMPRFRIHHDVIATARNTVLFLTRDAEQLIDDTLWVGDAIVEWDPETNVEQLRFNPFDVISPTTDRGADPRPEDWLHANSLSIGPRGNILVSWRSLNQVASIASDFQSLEWRLNGIGGSIDVADDAVFWGQHTAAEVSPGRVLVFDNGFRRPEGQYSRGLELQLDIETNTASLAWEFRAEPDNYAPFISSARRLDNGNTLVNFGVSQDANPIAGGIEVYEVTPTGQVIWHLVVNGPNTMYRATPLSNINGETVISDE